MIRKLGNTYLLETNSFSYIFKVNETGQLQHLYYGKLLQAKSEEDVSCLVERQFFPLGNVVNYDQDHLMTSLENLCLEYSSLGKGDVREPMVEIIHENGFRTSDFVFEKADILEGKEPLSNLPSAYEEDGTQNLMELVVTLKDRNSDVKLELHYGCFAGRDIITRSAKLINKGQSPVTVTRLLSMQLDLDKKGYHVTSFHGGWVSEMQKSSIKLEGGCFVNESLCGTSSSRSNPFVMLSMDDTTEESGDCYGFNLIYSGNHYTSVSVGGDCKTRILSGLNPKTFTYCLHPDEELEAPEVVMGYSHKGLTGLSHLMQEFVRNNIVRGLWKKKERPVLLNSWEANYFNISESKLISLAKAGKEVGVELFVMDDGWFGNRNDDKSSLGDWEVNTKKLPHGLKGLADKINDLGLDFGIWIEPEMVNVDSNLYKAHPEWVLECPGMHHSEGRNQRILDLCNPTVVDYLIDTFTKIFESANISYVKWDMNRIFSDAYSQYLKPEEQGCVDYFYYLGFYRLTKALTERFPHILFEGCASGGNRFDLGMLCYFPQIWASDNTDAIFRSNLQENLSYGYPLSVISAHVSSCPNHQTLRVTPLHTRFAVACFGVLGYECNLCDFKKEELEAIRAQIETYKMYRSTLQFGDFYRGNACGLKQWTVVDKNKENAVGMILQTQVEPNHQYAVYYPKGLDEEMRYHFFNLKEKYDLRLFGDLVNMVAPIHVKQDSLVHAAIAKFVSMPGEVEDFETLGSVLMGGVKLAPAFSGTGYSENVRFFIDYESRLYFMETAK